MKQKNYKRIFYGLKSGILIVFLLAGIFGVSLSYISAAGCTYSAVLTADKTAITADGGVNLTVTVTRQFQDLSQCSVSAASNFVLNLKQAGIFVNAPNMPNVNLSFTESNGTVAKTVFSFILGNFNRSNLNPPNQLNFQAVANVFDSSGKLTVTNSNIVSVNVTGAIGSSGTLSPSIYFQPAKDTFNNGETLDVCETVNAASVNALPAAIQTVHFGIYVTNSSNPVPSNPVLDSDISRADLLAQDVCSNGFTVSAANGFINGTNTITGKFVISGSGSGLGQGSATLQAQGLAAAAASPGTLGAAGAACTSPSACQSGVCTAGNCTTPPGTPTTVVPAPVVPNGDCSGPKPNPDYCLYNPLPVSSLTDTLLLIMKGFLGVIGVWAVAFIVIGGFRMVVSGGNEEQLTAAKKTITWAIIGLVVALLSFSIIAIVQSILGSTVQPVGPRATMRNNIPNFKIAKK